MRYQYIIMKTASVANLRNEFPKVFAWIESGEEVAITKRGRVVANLVPPKPQKHNKPDWAARLASRKPIGRPLNQQETDAFWSALRD